MAPFVLVLPGYCDQRGFYLRAGIWLVAHSAEGMRMQYDALTLANARRALLYIKSYCICVQAPQCHTSTAARLLMMLHI